MMETPKVISLFKDKKYEDLFPNISILGRGYDFFLECTSYNVVIPMKERINNQLDIFEEAVLKFIEYHPLEVTEIADELCLSSDLINFIIIRLQEMGALSKDGREITETGKSYLESNSGSIDEDDVRYETAKIFVVNKTGKILPYIQKGEFSTERVEDYNSSKLKINIGTLGNPYIIKGAILGDGNTKKRSLPGMLNLDQVKKAIINFNNIAMSSGRFDEINTLYAWKIENSVSDTVYFHMKVAIQDGNVDKILVSDGFVFNVDSVGDCIKESFKSFYLMLKERATENVLKSADTNAGNQVYRGAKYPQLVVYLGKIEEFWNKYLNGREESGLTIDEMQHYEAEQKAFFLDVYSAFEWSLYYHFLEYPLNTQMRKVVDHQSRVQNEKTICEMAQKIGIARPKKYRELFRMLDRDNLYRMRKNEVPELRVAVSVAILSAANDNTSPFRTLLKEQPEILDILQNLFLEHGLLAHETTTQEKDTQRCEEIYEVIKRAVAILQPDIKVGNKEFVIGKYNSLSQIKLNAEVSLAQKLGDLYFYNLLPDKIKNEWIQVAPNKNIYPEPGEYVNILYRIMQDTFLSLLIGVVDHIDVPKESILKRLKSQGIDSEVFNTVNEGFIKSIFKDKRGTLGSYAMVYLYHQSDETIKLLVNNGFVEVIETLVDLRQHGNKQLFNIDTAKLNEIRDKMLDIVKIMGGI